MKPISIYQFIPGIIWFFIVLVLICIPGQDLPQSDEWSLFLEKIHFDKFVHVTMFGVMMWLFGRPFQRSGLSAEKKKSVLQTIAVSVCVWGLLTECIQLWVPYRSFDLLDWAADSAGVWLAFRYFGFFSKN